MASLMRYISNSHDLINEEPERCEGLFLMSRNSEAGQEALMSVSELVT